MKSTVTEPRYCSLDGSDLVEIRTELPSTYDVHTGVKQPPEENVWRACSVAGHERWVLEVEHHGNMSFGTWWKIP